MFGLVQKPLMLETFARKGVSSDWRLRALVMGRGRGFLAKLSRWLAPAPAHYGRQKLRARAATALSGRRENAPAAKIESEAEKREIGGIT